MTVRSLSAGGQLTGEGAGKKKKKTVQNSLVYVSPNLASASNPDESTH